MLPIHPLYRPHPAHRAPLGPLLFRRAQPRPIRRRYPPRVPKHHRPRLASIPRARLQLGRMHPRLFGAVNSVGRAVVRRITLRFGELPGRESSLAGGRRLVGRDPGGRLGDDPVPTATRHLVRTDFHQAPTFDREEMAGGQHLDIDDRQDAVKHVMGVDLPRDGFFSDVMDIFLDGFVRHRCWKDELGSACGWSSGRRRSKCASLPGAHDSMTSVSTASLCARLTTSSAAAGAGGSGLTLRGDFGEGAEPPTCFLGR